MVEFILTGEKARKEKFIDSSRSMQRYSQIISNSHTLCVSMIYVHLHSAKRVVSFVDNVPTIHTVTVATVATTVVALAAIAQ